MTLTLVLPDQYGWVVLSCLVGQALTSMAMGGAVMKARTQFEVPYPNLYATPGFHKQADAFNRVQRGHQSMMETAPAFMIMAVLGGIK